MPVCPFVNASDPQCSAHLTLRNIMTAYVHCADRYTECPVYLALIGKTDAAVPAENALRVAS